MRKTSCFSEPGWVSRIELPNDEVSDTTDDDPPAKVLYGGQVVAQAMTKKMI